MIKLFGRSQIIGSDETVSVARNGKVEYVDGKPVFTKLLKFHVQANVQPMSARDLLLVPEGDRFKEQYWLFANNLSIVVNEGLDIQDKPSVLLVNDQVYRLGANYQVQSVEDWGSYSKSRIMRIDVGPHRTP